MRNLNLSHVSVKNINIKSEESFCSCYGHYDDLAKGDLYVCTSNLSVFNFDDKGHVKWTTNLCDLVPIQSKPVNISYLTLTNTLNVGLLTGELIALSDFGSNCDIVGICEDGLLAMEWSPDQELLVLVTTSLKVILMSCTFDPLSESSLLSEDFGEKAFITVGWGKKETQFHGSEGKQAAKANDNENAGEPVMQDDKVIISWRGDGNLFAVGYNVEGTRRFKVFDRDGNLQTTSEKVQGLEGNLSWRPSGNLIATTQKLAQKYVVTFFEKNGLKHGEFTLPVNTTTNIVEDLIWTSDSEVLIILCKDKETNCEVVFLYTRRNYHWYLKQTLNFRSDQKINNILCDSDFDAVNEKKIHVLCQNGVCYSYSWNWNIDHSTGKSSNDDAIVAVVDGKKVLVTDFRHVVVPPPMSNIELEFDNNVDSIHFISEGPNTDTNSFIVSFGNKMAIVQQIQKKPLQYSIIKTMTTDEYQFPFEHYKWHWLSNEILLCVSVNQESAYSMNQYKIENEKLIKTNNIMLSLPVTNIQSHPTDCTSVFLELNSGEILVYKCDGTVSPSDVYFQVLCPEFNVVSIDNELTFIGLSHKGCLYINDRLIINNVNSYFVHTQYILVTTLKHLLICVELTKSGIDSLTSYEKNETSSMVYSRKVERGSKLVIVVPNDTRTVFQMPRGNLETIQPRPLSLKIIGRFLDSLSYYEAFDLMRKQRINLNLIYDHNPKQFVDNVDVFLKSISNNSWLSLFLADLENVDVTKTMYSSSYSERRNDVIEPYSNSKIHHICDIIRIHIQKSSNSSDRILPLLTTFVKKNTIGDLEQALQLIKDLKIQETDGIKLAVSSDEALKYLLYLVNVDNLFDVALGMYDFDLVLLVANKSQKDPKEYIAMLNELNEMDEHYKRFSINKHLKRFNKAVECLAKCGQSRHADLRTFVKYHSLYREALILFTPDDEIFKQISDDYGSYLRLKKQYIEAGFVYEKAGSEDKAIECYKEALEWELVFKLAKNKGKDILDILISNIVKALKDEKRYTEAVNILEQYGNNQEETIIFAIGCSKYKTALRLCSLKNRNDLINTHLIPHLLEEYNNTRELIEKNRSNFIQYRSRLFVVRENKSKKNVENYDMCANRDIDLYSDAGSTIASSSGSGRSYRSSKNRRKHERKVASLKEGSQYEDTALVMALHSLVTSTFELRSQVRDLNIALCCCNRDKDAATLQLNLDSLLKAMKDSFKQIWNNELVIEATNATFAAENVPEGTTVIPQGMASLAPHMRIEPLIQDMKWKLEDLY